MRYVLQVYYVNTVCFLAPSPKCPIVVVPTMYLGVRALLSRLTAMPSDHFLLVRTVSIPTSRIFLSLEDVMVTFSLSLALFNTATIVIVWACCCRHSDRCVYGLVVGHVSCGDGSVWFSYGYGIYLYVDFYIPRIY